MQELLYQRRHGEAKPSCEVLPGEKHHVIFFAHSILNRALRQHYINVIGNFTIGPQLLHRQGGDDAACRRRLLGRPSLATRLAGGSLFLTSRHSTSRQTKKKGQRQSARSHDTKLVKGKTTCKPTKSERESPSPSRL